MVVLQSYTPLLLYLLILLQELYRHVPPFPKCFTLPLEEKKQTDKEREEPLKETPLQGGHMYEKRVERFGVYTSAICYRVQHSLRIFHLHVSDFPVNL